MPESVKVTARPFASTEERLAAVRLYRQAFGLSETNPAMTPKLLTALQRHGGSAVGAFDETGTLVGFTYGFVGLDGAVAYHHSQAAVVAPGLQGRGVGRELKWAQAQVALAHGMESMRWAYDPMRARNAHFNLDVLGAVGRWFHRDYYAMSDDVGPTDRVMVEWALRSSGDDRPAEPLPPSPVPAWGETARDGDQIWLAVPASWDLLARTDSDRAARLRDRVADQLERLLVDGAALVSCRRVSGDVAVYRIDRAPR